MTSMNSRKFLACLTMAAFFSQPLPSIAQEAAGPMFSTPAERSTTGVPILSDQGSVRNDTIIDSTGGHSRTQPVASDQNRKTSFKPDQFKQWALQCVDQANTQKRCQISSTTLSADSKQAVLVVSLAYRPDGKSVAMQMAVPLGIALKNGVELSVKSGSSTTFQVSRCTPQGCLVEDTVEPALIEAMKTGKNATVSVMTPEGAIIPIGLSLDGFSDAYSALIAH
ncbi:MULTISPECIES: invasion associated locus B family protein [Shinella]|uniref:Invasion associated locus B family protein n=1 Tax=Shinella sedimenti TaxID=2919913 RepID=A0ABT0CTS3_9HYPH|nr:MULTISPECIES: invasion associated locus B family protein [Shinella]MCJ8152018.1 invasion associated locus B family protein [Shinella sedimenti]